MSKSTESARKVGKGVPPEHTKWKAGQSGNPKGREEGSKNRATLYKKWLEVATTVKDLDDKELPGTYEDKISIAIIRKATDGDVMAAKEIADSVYGKAPQTIHNTGELSLNIVYKEQYGNDPLPE